MTARPPHLIRALAGVGLILFAGLAAFGQQRLLAVGGGKRPPEALRKFAEWSGARVPARILIVTWASGEPEASFEALQKDLAAAAPGIAVEHAAMRPLDAAGRSRFVDQLARATGVFFSGGDQNRIMDVLGGEAALLNALRQRYRAGTPMGGTSAGAAALSDPMMTGEADLKILDGSKVGVRPGLGLVADVIFDQHFLYRQRHNRLLGLTIAHRAKLGIGIDEDTAVAIEDDRRLTVIGESRVMIVDARDGAAALRVAILAGGERYDLRKRKALSSVADAR